MAYNNSINLKGTGVVTSAGDGTFSYSTVTDGAVLVAGSSNTITDTGVLAKGSLIVGDGSGAPEVVAVGSNNKILTADSGQSSGVTWTTPSAGSGAWSLVSTTTISSSVASQNITGMTEAGASYAVMFSNITTANSNVSLLLRTSNDGSSYASGASNYWTNSVGAGTSIDLDGSSFGSGGTGFSGMIYIFVPQDTGYCWMGFDTGFDFLTLGNVFTETACRQSAASVQAIQFRASSGNLTAGTIRLYKIAGS